MLNIRMLSLLLLLFEWIQFLLWRLYPYFFLFFPFYPYSRAGRINIFRNIENRIDPKEVDYMLGLIHLYYLISNSLFNFKNLPTCTSNHFFFFETHNWFSVYFWSFQSLHEISRNKCKYANKLQNNFFFHLKYLTCVQRWNVRNSFHIHFFEIQ